METSYFAKYRGNMGVSIARSTPSWFTGKRYSPLMPPWDLIKGYKNGAVPEEEYAKIYNKLLDDLDPQEVYLRLQDRVLLCWEKPGDFCHRRLVADWIQQKTGNEVPECDT